MSRNGRGAGLPWNTRTGVVGLATPDNLEEKVRRRLEKQQDHLFTFLDVEEVDATNNLAERQLRRPSSRARSPAAIKRRKELILGKSSPVGCHLRPTGRILRHLVSQNAVLSPAR